MATQNCSEHNPQYTPFVGEASAGTKGGKERDERRL